MAGDGNTCISCCFLIIAGEVLGGVVGGGGRVAALLGVLERCIIM